MNRLSKTFILTCCICLAASIVFTGCKTSSIPVENIPITIEPCVDDTEGDITFENVTLAKGILEKDYFTPWAGDHKKGEPCFLISGRIVNDSGTRYWVAYFADGLDDAGNRVAGTLDAGPLVGIAQVGIEPRSAEEFTLHLGWADNATSFTLHSQKWTQMFP